jgi:hypothetical protein
MTDQGDIGSLLRFLIPAAGSLARRLALFAPRVRVGVVGVFEIYEAAPGPSE